MNDKHLITALDHILAQEQLTAVFQPIVSLGKQSIFGYEGLIRGPADSLLHRPEMLFAAASKHQRLVELDFLSRKIVIRQFAKLKLPGRLFININPVSMGENDFINSQTLLYLQNHELDPTRVVIEITETHPIEDLILLKQALSHYHNMGFQVALDDLGAGYSGLKLWSEMNPDFVKIDRHFIENVNEDKTKRQFVASILEIARSLGCETITEGVESKDEYATLRKLGVNLAQGFYFDRPQAKPKSKLDSTLFSERQTRKTNFNKPTANSLLKESPSVAPETPVEAVGEMFQASTELRSIPVVYRGAPLGLVLRNELMNLLASRYGRELHGRKPIWKFIRQRVLFIEKNTPLEEVSRQVTNALNFYTEEFIITDNGQFLGNGTLLELLRNITEFQIHSARYANPLTLLPGNVLIQQTLDSLLDSREKFAVAYYDLDHFKPYNDVYGYGRGDNIIQLLGRLLQESADPEADFVGHIGGDDFIVLFRSPDWQERCHTLLETFQALIQDHYTSKDRQQGGIEATDRFGSKRRFPIMSLSIGVLAVNSNHDHLSHEFIAELASRAKANAKKNQGNSVCVETLNSPPLRERENAPAAEMDLDFSPLGLALDS